MPSKTMDNVKTINSSVRTLVLVAFVAGIGALAWLGFDQWVRPGLEAEKVKRQMAELQVKFQEQSQELARTHEQLLRTLTALKLIKVDHRKAIIKVLERDIDPNTDEPYFVVEFTEIDQEGLPVAEPREFRLRGTKMFVDSWVVKFEDKHIEQADEFRSASLCVFKAIWGDIDQRNGGQTLDRNGSDINQVYGTIDPQSDFEKQIWEDFWSLANDPVRQQEMGIRGNHGQVIYLEIEAGSVYEVDLRASDGLTLKRSRETHNTSTSNPSG